MHENLLLKPGAEHAGPIHPEAKTNKSCLKDATTMHKCSGKAQMCSITPLQYTSLLFLLINRE